MKPDNLLLHWRGKVPNPAVNRKDEDESHAHPLRVRFFFDQRLCY